jgi:acetylornithine aminotransferase/acetylornithine/N-succinyldiaminopimelate aminotransferase
MSGMDRVFFCNSGTEAIEGALKLARVAARKRGFTERTRILALERSFHGRTFGALSVTHPVKYREPFEPLVPGVEFVRMNDVAELEAKFDDSVCAMVVEVIQGEGGIYPMSGQFWTRARELATHYGAALIADEIQCGLGRTGRDFGYQRHPGLPDIVVVAKPLAGGLPLGAILAQESFAEAFSPGLHGSTFGGGPLTCAMALEFLSIVEDEDLLENVRDRGAQLRAGLQRLGAEFDFIHDVRGEGLIVGADLTVEGRPYVEAALCAGLIINCTHDHVIRLLPPFNVTAKQVDECLKILRTVFAETKRPIPFRPPVSEGDSTRALAASR